MDLLNADKFTKAEDMLMEELKLNCNDGGREIDPEVSVPIFRKLDSLHLRRSEICSAIEGMICLIRCAVLLNAALVRTRHDANVIKHDLQQLHSRVLQSAEAAQKDFDLRKTAEKVKLSVEKMRKHVDQELRKISNVEEHESENIMDHQELNKVEAIESLQNKVTADYTQIMANIANECEQIMGKPPCNFTIVGMGSLARKEITPYSDFEHVIVLGPNFDGQSEITLNYFRWYSVIFQIILVNLGETIIPSVLNETNSKFGRWFYDDVTKSGLSFDGTFPWACKFPLGRQQATKNKKWKTELIKSIPDMLKYLNCEESLKNGYHLGDILTKICYVYGNQNLYEVFETGVKDILKQQNKNFKVEVLRQVRHDLENFAIRSVLLKITDEGNYNVKKDVYRVTTLFIAALGRLNKLAAFSCFDIIRDLSELHVISVNAKQKLMYAVAIACEIRLRWYMVNKRQKDDINDKDATSTFLKLVGKKSAINYFQIAYALQCDISKRFALKKGYFYSHPDLLNIIIYWSFQSNLKLEDCITTFKADANEQRLLDFDSCFKMLKAKSTHKQSVMETDTDNKAVLCGKFQLIGQDLLNMNKLIDAKEYLEKSLNIKQRISSDVATDRDLADIFHQIGLCLFLMRRPTDAIRYLEKALAIEERTSDNVATDKSMATTLLGCGRCLIEMNKLNDAKKYLEKSLEIEHRISSDVTTNRDIAITLQTIGLCLFRMNKYADAKKYLENALKIKLQTSSDVATDKYVAVTFDEIGRCLIEMNKHSDAKDHLVKALKIKQRISSNVATDRNVATTLHEIGRCFVEMNELNNAKEYLEKSLAIDQRISSDVASDKNVAVNFHEIGRCLLEMKQYIDAKEYLDKSLEITQRLSSGYASDKSIAATSHDIGRYFIKMNEPTKAKEYLDKALKIKQQISSDVTTDKNIAATLHETGRCLIKMNKMSDAKEYLEKALKIREQISSDVANEGDVAATLHDIGRCLVPTNEVVDAEEYLQKKPNIQQQISIGVATDS